MRKASGSSSAHTYCSLQPDPLMLGGGGGNTEGVRGGRGMHEREREKKRGGGYDSSTDSSGGQCVAAARNSGSAAQRKRLSGLILIEATITCSIGSLRQRSRLCRTNTFCSKKRQREAQSWLRSWSHKESTALSFTKERQMCKLRKGLKQTFLFD